MEIVLYLLAGIVGGVLGGMGMGGGTLLIPILTLFLDVPQHTAQLINLAAFVPMSIATLFIHVKNGFVVWREIVFIIVPAVLFAVFGSNLAVQVSSGLLQKLFCGFLVLLGAWSLIVPKIKA